MARLVIMSSYLYYHRASPVVSDDAFDKGCRYVAENWELVEPIHRFQLESPEAIVASGHHVILTRLSEHAAIAWHVGKKGVEPHGDMLPRDGWYYDLEWRCWMQRLGG